MENTPSQGSNLLDRFVSKNCLVASDFEPTTFWGIHTQQAITISTLPLYSIPIALAVADAAFSLEGVPKSQIREVAYADVGWVNTDGIERLQEWWDWNMSQIN